MYLYFDIGFDKLLLMRAFFVIQLMEKCQSYYLAFQSLFNVYIPLRTCCSLGNIVAKWMKLIEISKSELK